MKKIITLISLMVPISGISLEIPLGAFTGTRGFYGGNYESWCHVRTYQNHIIVENPYPEKGQDEESFYRYKIVKTNEPFIFLEVSSESPSWCLKYSNYWRIDLSEYLTCSKKKKDSCKYKKTFDIQQFKTLEDMLDINKVAPTSSSYYMRVPAGVEYP